MLMAGGLDLPFTNIFLPAFCTAVSSEFKQSLGLEAGIGAGSSCSERKENIQVKRFQKKTVSQAQQD